MLGQKSLEWHWQLFGFWGKTLTKFSVTLVKRLVLQKFASLNTHYSYALPFRGIPVIPPDLIHHLFIFSLPKFQIVSPTGEAAAMNTQQMEQMGQFKITVWEEENFQGKRCEFMLECQNIMERGFNKIRSIKVENGP